MMASLVDRAKTALAFVRSKNLDTWVGGYARWLAASAVPRARATLTAERTTRHLLFAFCDHYEPLWSARTTPSAGAGSSSGSSATPRWRASSATPTGGPRATASSSRARSTRPRYLDGLASLARPGLGEVELHLHHDGDTAGEAAPRRSTSYLRTLRRARPPVAATRRAAPLRVHPRQLVPGQRAAATAAGAASTRSCRCCSRPAATPTSPSRRRPTSASRTSSTRSTGPTGDLARRRAYEQRRAGAGRRAPARSHADDRPGRWRWRRARRGFVPAAHRERRR